MLDVLVIKNLDWTVEEDALPPDGMDGAAAARAVKQARAIIRLHVSNNLVPIIEGTDDARSAWVTLEDTFRSNLMPCCLALTKQLNSVKLNRSKSITTHACALCATILSSPESGLRLTHSPPTSWASASVPAGGGADQGPR
eukprot:314702-Chlamydomonas_euryale.AAC.1